MAKIMEDDPAFQDQESSLQSDCICQIDKASDTQKGMNLQEPPKPAHC